MWKPQGKPEGKAVEIAIQHYGYMFFNVFFEHSNDANKLYNGGRDAVDATG